MIPHIINSIMQDQASLTPNEILLGSLCALEQCGLLLGDAAVLLENRRYPTAAGVALFAREELGRHEIWLGLWRECLHGVTITPAHLNDAADDHVKKQQQSGQSVAYRLKPGDQMAELLNARTNAAPGSDQWRAAQEQIDLMDARRRKQQPTDRHDFRMRAFYVDIMEDGTITKPNSLDPQSCADEVKNAINAYMLARQRVDPDTAPIYGDVEFMDALSALLNIPVLPPPPDISIGALLPSTPPAGPVA